MLEKLKFLSNALHKGIELEDIKRDIVNTIIELNDPELAYLYIASSNSIPFDYLRVLIQIVKNNPEVDSAKWVNRLIVVLNNKPKIIKNEFIEEISDLDYVALHYLNENYSIKK